MELNTKFQISDETGSIMVSEYGSELLIHDFESKGDDAVKVLLRARKFIRDTYPGRDACIWVDVNNAKMLDVMNKAGFRVEHYVMRGKP